ncbi:MAG: glycosyltransferase family 4 protein [Acidimicrobiales bacterium]
MRVLQVHNRYRSSAPSGENRVVDNEAAALRLHGHTVDRFERTSEEIAGSSLGRKLLLGGQVLWSIGSYNSLTRHLRESRPDVVHVHNTFPLLSASVLQACLCQRVPVVATLHNYRLVCPSGALYRDGAICHECVGRVPVPAVRHGCYRGSSLATLPLAACVSVNREMWRRQVSAYVCISESQRRLLSPADLPVGRVFVKTNLVPWRDYSPPTSPRPAAVVFLGRLDANKGVLLLMEAWDLFAATAVGHPLRLVIAGAGPLEGTVAEWANGRSDVDYLGLLSAERCEGILKTARATVVPSAWEEPFGMVVVESMRMGVPVLAAAHGSFPELVVEGEDGALFPPGDAGALAKVLSEVEQDPGRFARYGENARKAYETRFSATANIEELVGIYRFAIAHPVWGTS